MHLFDVFFRVYTRILQHFIIVEMQSPAIYGHVLCNSFRESLLPTKFIPLWRIFHTNTYFVFLILKKLFKKWQYIITILNKKKLLYLPWIETFDSFKQILFVKSMQFHWWQRSIIYNVNARRIWINIISSRTDGAAKEIEHWNDPSIAR